MARNALEAVFGALGGGLVGYGKDKQNRYAQEQDAIDREERRKRTELADVLKAAEMMQSGSYGTESQLQSRQQAAGRTAMQAAMFAATAGKGPPSAAPMPTDVARAVPQLRRGMDAPSVSIGGQNLRMLETEPERAQIATARAGMDRAARRTEGREDAVFESGLAIERDAAGVKARQSGDERADRIDRTRRAAAEYLQRSKGNPDGTGGVIAYSPQELSDLRTEIYAAYGLNPSGSDLTVVPPPDITARRKDGESVAEFLARTATPAVGQSPNPAQPFAPTATPPDSAINSPRVASIRRQLDELSQGRSGSITARARYESYAPQRLALEQELQELGLRYSRGYILPARNR